MSGLLGGPDPRGGAESAAAHRARLGVRPRGFPDLVPLLERSGLTGRGGGGFPVGAKWRAVARAGAAPVVLVNGSEGEPLSRKDDLLMRARPHLVLDGALLAAEALGAERVVLYAGEDHPEAVATLARALAERGDYGGRRLDLVVAPPGYVTGEETAAVNFLNTGVAVPVAVPPRPYERGVDGRPTLVQNVESLAHVALIARNGDAWFRERGVDGAPGSVLLTVGDHVHEVAAGTPLGDVLEAAGRRRARAVLLGGYFGGWVRPEAVAGLRVDAAGLAAAGHSLGCGVVRVLEPGADPLAETARVMGYLARQSAAQCGPCFFGLRALAATCERFARREATAADLERLRRWAREVAGRGACRHPDGAVRFLASALQVFASEFAVAAARAA